jgi:hypothetical protein
LRSCAACGTDLPDSRIIATLRQDGYRIWALIHECGNGPLENIALGTAPVPRTPLQTMIHHVCHGLLMRYPLWSIFRFAWTNRNTFDESPFTS